jgi:hypothetical protein
MDSKRRSIGTTAAPVTSAASSASKKLSANTELKVTRVDPHRHVRRHAARQIRQLPRARLRLARPGETQWGRATRRSCRPRPDRHVRLHRGCAVAESDAGSYDHGWRSHSGRQSADDQTIVENCGVSSSSPEGEFRPGSRSSRVNCSGNEVAAVIGDRSDRGNHFF